MQTKNLIRVLLLWILMVELLATDPLDVDNFIFNGFMSGSNLSLDGSASILPNGLLCLTKDRTQNLGHAYYSTPLRFRQNSPNGNTFSFSTTFLFSITPDQSNHTGHGIAFFISPTTYLPSSLPGYFGIFNPDSNGNKTNHIFAELDTILNPELFDINDNHVGVDINGLQSNMSRVAGYYDSLTGEFHSLSLYSGETMQAWVDYDGAEMQLNVTLSPVPMAKPKRPLLSFSMINLSSILSDHMYVGFSSSTGAAAVSHYLFGWSFKMNGMAEAFTPSVLSKAVIKEESKHQKTRLMPAVIVSVALLVGIMGVAILMVRRKIKFSELLEDWELQYGPHRFSYKTLFKATKGFNDKQLLGVGGFGKVAVKRVSHESRQGMREFIAEIVTLGHLRHRNLVQLLGNCWRKGELLLVYEYMPNDSLGNFLHCKDKPALNWSQRLNIIKGVASGLEYLHEDWEQVVIHRDIKTNNVLLDSELNGRLSDFGLARLYDHNMDPQTTQVAGTMGYIAPELARTGRPTTMTDVFAFGVFVLEVACGRRPLDFKVIDDNQIVLVDWVLENWKNGTIVGSIDQRLGDECNVDAYGMEFVLELGLLCSHPLPALRPSMKQVVQCLNGDAPLPLLSLAFSDFSLQELQQNEGFDKYLLSCPNTSIHSSSADLRCISIED
ncbi:Non-specific serine/threonine protein kinase protein [Dioscorea alata]|uniref:Non-specific serine/threonine protein kinase protein n=1 Tax=Dioscorea alata TaxID=55571 RepID=A0ACB7VHA8_DIOAL|nr:Non-specific serine/threonine protein kinase protein [Dioscorea alata]